MSHEKSARIRALNDAFRTTGLGSKIVCTQGAFGLGGEIFHKIRKALTEYDDFTPDNDPYGEHDFGSFEVGEHKLFWKIDYYAEDMMHGSDDACDPAKTKHVLTIMLRDEY